MRRSDPVQWGLPIPERLKLIIRAFDVDSDDPTFERVAKQFRYETGRALDRDDYEAAMKKEK